MWLQELGAVGLLGEDYILLAPNSSMDGWLDRPADYSDIRRAMLHVCWSLSIVEAVSFNPHSFRHFMVEAGQQLRSLNVCSETDLEKLGHWSNNSSMPSKYDNAAAESELQARYRIIESLKTVWRPVSEGVLPMQLPSGRVLVQAGHKVTKKLHMAWSDEVCTLCKMWTCGSGEAPAKTAVFVGPYVGFSNCDKCAGMSNGSRAVSAVGARGT